MGIESLTIRNYRALREVELKDLRGLSVFVGANGTGKSTLFDVFGFLQDSLVHNVRQALAKRGGFQAVLSRGASAPIEVELEFRQAPNSPLVTYYLAVALDERGIPVVAREILKYQRGQYGQPWHLLDFARGQGSVVTNEQDYSRPDGYEKREETALDEPDILAVKSFGQLHSFVAASALRKLIENWHVSDFHAGDARPSQELGLAAHLSTRGENLALVAQYLFERHPQTFDQVVRKMTQRVPGIAGVKPVTTEDGRLVLRFQDGAFKAPFNARYVSDGTIKMFAYLLLLHDPAPHPLLSVEEPEHQLGPDLLPELAGEFRDYARRGGQVFLSTHSPELLNALSLEEIYWLAKEDGFTSFRRASEDDQLQALVEAGDKPGALWKQGLFPGARPR